MPIIYKKNCDTCGKYYEGYGEYFCSRKCQIFTEATRKKLSKSHIGIQAREKHPRWKGGKVKIAGYWYILKPDHPRAFLANRYVKQATLIAEKCLGRNLTSEEIIHHMGKTDDDRSEMLYLFSSQKEHAEYEHLKNKPELTSNL